MLDDKEKTVMKKLLLLLCVALAACTPTTKQADIERSDMMSDQDWELVCTKPDYFKELLALQEKSIAGKKISVSKLQDLMPQTEEDFNIFIATQRYAIVEEDGDLIESPQALYIVAGDMAAADALDMMRLYLKWFDWADGWVAETVWDKAIEIEKRHPEKFKKLMQDSEWYDAWREFRQELYKYEEEAE